MRETEIATATSDQQKEARTGPLETPLISTLADQLIGCNLSGNYESMLHPCQILAKLRFKQRSPSESSYFWDLFRSAATAATTGSPAVDEAMQGLPRGHHFCLRELSHPSSPHTHSVTAARMCREHRSVCSLAARIPCTCFWHAPVWTTRRNGHRKPSETW